VATKHIVAPTAKETGKKVGQEIGQEVGQEIGQEIGKDVGKGECKGVGVGVRVGKDGQEECMEVGVGGMGVIVHWGVYSVPAFDSVESARRRGIQNGSEWYLQRQLVSSASFRPTSGWAETQRHHQTHYGAAPYRDFAAQFRAETWRTAEEPDRWMRLFRAAGASYVILTAKHHDGFCLWPTRTTGFNSVASGAKRDLVAAFKAAAHRNGLAFGVYYSWTEFEEPCTKKYLDAVVRKQIDELIAYEPAVFWFDGDWKCATQYSQRVMDECCAKIRRLLPAVEINDRVGHKQARTDPNALGFASSTYRVYADRAIPAAKPHVKWEHVNTIGLSWGRNREQVEADYKPAQELVALKKRVATLGGRFLLNVGPNADGTLCPQEIDRLHQMATLAPPPIPPIPLL
jgi:alpha-L-fucosidase